MEWGINGNSNDPTNKHYHPSWGSWGVAHVYRMRGREKEIFTDWNTLYCSRRVSSLTAPVGGKRTSLHQKLFPASCSWTIGSQEVDRIIQRTYSDICVLVSLGHCFAVSSDTWRSEFRISHETIIASLRIRLPSR